MNSVRYTYFIISVTIFSWPILMQTSFNPWFIWLYPFVVWFLIMLAALIFDRNLQCDKNNRANH